MSLKTAVLFASTLPIALLSTQAFSSSERHCNNFQGQVPPQVYQKLYVDTGKCQAAKPTTFKTGHRLKYDSTKLVYAQNFPIYKKEFEKLVNTVAQLMENSLPLSKLNVSLMKAPLKVKPAPP